MVWLTVSKAADKSRRMRSEAEPASAATPRSIMTLIRVVSRLKHFVKVVGVKMDLKLSGYYFFQNFGMKRNQ